MTNKIVLMMITALLILNSGLAGAINTPKYLNYQSVLYDDGGNPLSDGPVTLSIRILDSDLSVLFEEEQEVEVVRGQVSVTIGDGIDPASGAPSGGIGPAILLPDGPRYLEVEAGGYPAEGFMEIVSVPYSTYADIALGVADGVIGGDQIMEGAITMAHLTEDAVAGITNELIGDGGETAVIIRDEFDEYKDSISGSGGAGNVGVMPDFTYSAAGSVQEVLRDFDLAIKKREEDAKKADQYNLSLDGSDAMAGSLNMNNNRITGLPAPSADADAATKIYTDDKAAAVDMRITTEAARLDGRISTETAVLDERISTHTANTENPHGVTATQTGAVAASDLYGEHGLIMDSKIPGTIARLSDIPPLFTFSTYGSGRIVNGSVDSGFTTNMTCEVEASSTTSASVVCLLSGSSAPRETPSSCSTSRQIVPRFSASATCALPGNGGNVQGRPTAPVNFSHSVSLWSENNGPIHCDEIVSFDINGYLRCLGHNPMGTPGDIVISWDLYAQSY